MKIVFYYYSMRSGGAERTIAALANAFARCGDRVVIFTQVDDKSFYPLDANVSLQTLDTARDSRHIGQSIYNNLHTMQVLRKKLCDVRPDVVIAFSFRFAVLAKLASFGTHTAVVCAERSNPRYNLGHADRMLVSLVSNVINGYVFQTEGAAQCYPLQARRRAVVIPNGLFAGNIRTDRLPQIGQMLHICTVARMDYTKDYRTLLYAFARFHRDHPVYRLTIYGEGMLRAKIEALVDKLDIRESVSLPGVDKDIVNRLFESSMFVLSSRFEGMPNALMEAMACGLPCIATDCDFGPGELIDDGINGLLVPVGDVKAMAAAMTRFADNPTLAEAIGRNAAGIRQTHSFKNVFKQWREYIQKVKNNNQ